MVWAGALYYPYMRVRDKDWLKATALYWDSVRRFQPRDYVLRESPDCRLLIEAGVLRSLDPERYAAGINRELMQFMRDNMDMLRRRFGISGRQVTEAGPGWGTEGPRQRPDGLGWIHASKMVPELSDLLSEEGLAYIGRGGDHRWVGVHPTVAAAYMLALAGECAKQEGLEPVTDNPSPLLSTTHGVAAAIRLLTGGSVSAHDAGDSRHDVAGFAMLAIESVMPTDLSAISVECILDVKDRLGEELATFRAFVAGQREELQQLAAITSDEVRAEAFAAHINAEIKKPLEHLERGLKRLGFDTIRSLLTMQTLAPPAAVTYISDQAHAPPAVAVVGAAGVAIGSAWWQLAKDREEQIQKSPIGYLLSVKRALKPRIAVRRRAALLAKG